MPGPSPSCSRKRLRLPDHLSRKEIKTAKQKEARCFLSLNLTRGQSRKSTETKRKTVYLARKKQAKTKLKLINITLMVNGLECHNVHYLRWRTNRTATTAAQLRKRDYERRRGGGGKLGRGRGLRKGKREELGRGNFQRKRYLVRGRKNAADDPQIR